MPLSTVPVSRTAPAAGGRMRGTVRVFRVVCAAKLVTGLYTAPLPGGAQEQERREGCPNA